MELLVVLSVVSFLASVALPAFSRMVGAVKLSSASNDLFLSLTLTRSEAIKRNGRAVLCKSQSGLRCDRSGDWGQGWIVFADPNDNAQVDPGEAIVLRQGALDSTLSVSGNTNIARYVSFTPLGVTKLVSGAFQSGTFTLCTKSREATVAREIKISSVGRARVVKTTLARCPETGS